MSISSRTLKHHEMPKLLEAQAKAVEFDNYRTWHAWMLATFSYALSVRMCVYMGCKRPNGYFYNKMLAAGRRKGENLNVKLSKTNQSSSSRTTITRNYSGERDTTGVHQNPLTPRKYC